jgi:hypothetical protein
MIREVDGARFAGLLEHYHCFWHFGLVCEMRGTRLGGRGWWLWDEDLGWDLVG